MISERSKAICLLLLALLAGLAALTVLAAVALAGSPDKSAGVSIVLHTPYATVVEAVRAVCTDGLIRGTFQYESETAIGGASEAGSSLAFPRWIGPGQVFYKARLGAIAPAHFKGARDRGAATVRYVIEPEEGERTRVTIDAVFVEDTHHGRHASQGFVETAEFGEIARQIQKAGGPINEAAAVPAIQTERPGRTSSPVQNPGDRQEPEANQPSSAVAQDRSGPPGRTYSREEAELKKALQALGAFDDAALPSLEGFASVSPDGLTGYDRPHYQFRVAFEPAGSGRTTVRIESVLTARYKSAPGVRPEYRSVPSNGRLEADLFDRLDDYLQDEKGTSASTAANFRQQGAGPHGKK